MTNVSHNGKKVSTLCFLQRDVGHQSYGEATCPESCHGLLGSTTAGTFDIHSLLPMAGQGRWCFIKEIIQSRGSFITGNPQTPTLSACQFLFSQV